MDKREEIIAQPSKPLLKESVIQQQTQIHTDTNHTKLPFDPTAKTHTKATESLGSFRFFSKVKQTRVSPIHSQSILYNTKSSTSLDMDHQVQKSNVLYHQNQELLILPFPTDVISQQVREQQKRSTSSDEEYQKRPYSMQLPSLRTIASSWTVSKMNQSFRPNRSLSSTAVNSSGLMPLRLPSFRELSKDTSLKQIMLSR
ncbi:uncharacterized protein BX664DRAFT_327066 [Halteromyces radiatus]|uniref:uncharacterized protein n=1 Tax=Halteromyces radiatus TaxID=101107 RepID=UPI002220E173|nr:uncharacterized protein BX664DRAFT_327066 [Halteromyces radiatus]KAI8097709.1 hypothetical protein BX664DRAFT_327066 [Halteromyces radiatus]